MRISHFKKNKYKPFIIRKIKWIRKTLMRACALFMFDQCKNTKDTTLILRQLFWEDAMTERTFERWFAEFRKGDRFLRTSRALNANKSSIVNLWRLCRCWFRRDKPGIDNRIWMMPANDNQCISWHRKGVQARGWIPFKLTENHEIQRMLICQSMLSMTKKLFHLNFNWRRKVDRVRQYQSRVTVI